MTSKIATIANLAYHAFQQHSLRSAIASGASPVGTGGTTNVNQSNSASGCLHSTTANPSPQDRTQSCLRTDALHPLLSTVQSLTPKDVGFDWRWISDTSLYASPVIYVHIMENEIFSMGIFVLRPGSRIPLHDHPGMYGVLRVLHGALRCRSFSLLNSDDSISNATVQSTNTAASPTAMAYPPNSALAKFAGSKWQLSDVFRALPHQDVVINADSPAYLLSPTEGNLHEIVPVDGPAVFLDILAPPYDHDLGTRECRFYKEIILPPGTGHVTDDERDRHTTDRSSSHAGDSVQTVESDSASSIVYLFETNQPKDYWCESAEYVGPSVL